MKLNEAYARHTDPEEPPVRVRKRDQDQGVASQGYRRSQRSRQSKDRR